MDNYQKAAAQACLRGAESNEMAFPQIVSTLVDAGFESYAIDFRRAAATYYLAEGGSLELPAHQIAKPIAAIFDSAAMNAAVREAQQLVSGYTYLGFCAKAASAGCAGYIVSFLGRRAVYFGRTGETHVEHFPD